MEKPPKPGRRSRSVKQDKLEFQEAEQINENPDSPCWFLTNRNNLLDILSSGIIKPASLYTKYYSDMGAWCPGGIPLLMEKQVPSVLIKEAIGEDPDIFPVLVEINLASVSGVTQVITENYEIEESALPSHKKSLCMVFPGTIPASCIQAVHFRSAREKEEHVARSYENIRGEGVRLLVTPEYFDASLSALNVVLLREKLTQLGQICTLRHPELFSAADALGGALLMLGKAVIANPYITLSAISEPLEALEHPGDSINILKSMMESESSTESKWLRLLPSLLLSSNATDVDQEKRQAEISHIIATYAHKSGEIAEFLLFETIIRLLSQETINNFLKEEMLQCISSEFEKKLAAFPHGQIDSLQPHYAEQIKTIRSIVHNRADIDAFSVENSPTAAALLFFLQRSSPSEAFSWFKDLPSNACHILVYTVAFAGLLYGRANIPVDCRPDILFEQTIDARIAYIVNKTNQGLEFKTLQEKMRIETEDDNSVIWQSIVVSERTILRRRWKPPVVNKTLQETKNSQVGAHASDFNARDTVRQRAKSQREYVLKRFQVTDLRKSRENDIAVFLCQVSGWTDCVTTVFSLEGRKFILTNSDDISKPELRVLGLTPVPSEIRVHAARFRKHLMEDWVGVPEEVRNEVEGRLKQEDKS